MSLKITKLFEESVKTKMDCIDQGFNSLEAMGEEIVNLILSERKNQDVKWGEQNHNIYKWLAILGEEVGEVNKAALEDKYDDIIDELIQVGAVTIAMIESLERNRQK